MELRNDSGLEFTDISSERWREYLYADGTALTVARPAALHVSESGGHRILDAAGFSWYVAPGWRAIRWLAREDAPHFVK